MILGILYDGGVFSRSNAYKPTLSLIFILFDQFSLHSKHFCAILLRKLGPEREEGGWERKKP